MIELYKEVPKTLLENLEWRHRVRVRAAQDDRFRAALMVACREDCLFFFNAFGWLYEPRPRILENGAKSPPIIPFITWPHQDPAILRIKENLGFRDIGIEKSRGEGASWIINFMALHDFLFDPMSAIGFVSRTMDAADKPDDPDSMLWKFLFALEKLPRWMKPNYKRSVGEHVVRNVDNSSTVTAYAATGDVASGGRKKWFGMDELAKYARGPDVEAMASTQHVTNSRLIVSTPKGSEGAYYELMHEPSTLVKIELDWKQNPTKNRGLYRFQNGKPVAVDAENNPLPESYSPPDQDTLNLFSMLRQRGFKLEGTLRSPWYDQECARPQATPQSIAQELDRDYGGSMYRVFGHEVLAKADASACPPVITGTMSYDPESLEPDFEEGDSKEMRIWCPLSFEGRPPPGQYIVSCDISNGLGGNFTSNSVACVMNLATMEQVAEWCSNTVEPGDFAELSIAIAKMFHNALLSWEANGPGNAFTARVIARKYPDIWKRKVLYKRSNKRKRADLGWWTDSRSKEVMMSQISQAIRSGNATIRSKELAHELGQYVRILGKIEHVLEAKSKDDSSKGESHGDRVIAFGVGIMAAKDRPPPSKGEAPAPHSIRGTMAERQLEYEKSLETKDDEWDSRTMQELANPQQTRRFTADIQEITSDW